MKKILAFALSIVLLLTALFVPVTVSAETKLIATDSVSEWDGYLTVAEKGQYIRPKVLSDGTIGAAWYVMGDGGHFGISSDGGVTYKETEGVTVVKNSWSTTEEERSNGIYKYGRLEVQNPNFIEMKDGKLLYTYRYNTYTSEPDGEKTWDTYYSSIRYQISDNKGESWSEPVIIKETLQEDPDNTLGRNGYWEPEPYYIGEDLYVYWCDTVTNYNNLGVQNILGAKWNGNGFGESFIAIDGNTNNSREGMCVVTELSDGTYAMVFESTDTDDNANTHNDCGTWYCTNCDKDDITFVIKMARSTDGVNWNAEKAVTIAQPDVKTGHTDKDGAQNVCASPYVVTLPDGRVAISYQTTDLYSGDVIPSAVVRRSVVQVAVSDIAIGNTTVITKANFKKIASSPANVGENQFANAGSLLYNNGFLTAYSYIGTNALKEDGTTVGHTTHGIRAAYINLADNSENLSTDSIDDYIVYNSGKKDVTVNEDGSFTFPTGATNMLVGKENFGTETKTIAIENLYNEKNYTRYAGTYTFDTANRVITTKGQGKALLTATEKMETFNARVTIQGNTIAGDTNEGYIFGGFSIFVNPDTIENAKFNPEGILIGIRRNTTKLNLVELVVRYCDSTGTAKDSFAKTLSSTFDITDLDPKFTLDVSSDGSDYTVKVYNAETGEQMGSTYTYSLSRVSAMPFTSGALSLMVNGVHTFSDFELNNATYSVEADNSEMVKAADLDASAEFTFADDITSENQAGFDLRVQKAANASPGITGYALKLVQNSTYADGTVKLQLTRYGTRNDGVTYNANLGDMKTYTDTTVLGGSAIQGATIIMDAKLRDNLLTVTLTNKANASLTSTYEFDLTMKSTKNSVVYDNYYEEGGFGFFKNGNYNITVSNIKFERVASNVEKLDTELFTTYTPAGANPLTAEGNAFVSDNDIAKKAMLNGTTVSDFTADATFKIGEDGYLKGGIIFRAQNVGDETDSMEGYSAVLYKTTPKNDYGRILICVYKWGREADGNMKYLGEVGRSEDTKTLASVYPSAASSLIASAGKNIKLNLKVDGNKVIVNFDVLDNLNMVAASSATKTIDLKAKTFASEAEATLYNAGAVGLSISSKGKICDFNVTADDGMEMSDIAGYTVYSNTDKTMTLDSVNRKMYSTTSGRKQAVLNGVDLSEFVAKGTLKSNTAGTVYNMGFDFNINEETHSGYAYNAGHATMGYEGYRVVLVRNQNTDANPAKAILYIFKFEKGDSGYTRTKVEAIGNDNFFANYTTPYNDTDKEYAEIEVDLEVSLIGGVLTATATMCEYPEKTITATVEGIEGSGAIGWFISDYGSISNISVNSNGLDNELINVAENENGQVYTTVNSGAAKQGATVKVETKANEGYRLDTVSLDSEVMTETENGYVFIKTNEAANIAADFFLVGDIDDTDKVDSADIICMRKELLGSQDYNDKYTDINGDTVINLKDLVKIKKIAVGIK